MRWGMMPIFAAPGVMSPGQFGPSSRAFGYPRRKSLTRIMSWIGIPSVMHTMSSMPLAAASMMASGANGGGTNIPDAFAPVARTASATVLNTGTPRWVVPPLPGLVPPTSLVPISSICSAWKVPSRPVMPWTRTRVHQDDGERVLDHLRLGAASDVAEVGRAAACPLDEIQRAHAEARAVADDPDVAVERDIRKSALLGLNLVRVAFQHRAIPLLELLVPPRGVFVGFELRVARDDLAFLGDHQGIDLGSHGVELGDGPVKPLDQRHDRPGQVPEPGLEDELTELKVERSTPRVRIQAR